MYYLLLKVSYEYNILNPKFLAVFKFKLYLILNTIIYFNQ